MIDYIKNLILGNEYSEGQANVKDEERQLQVATCALFLELAHSDDVFTIEEKEFIESKMKEKFNLDDKTVTQLIELSTKKTEQSISLYEYSEIINTHFNNHSKYEILKNLWRLVFADGNLDAYEEHFMRKITGNLRMDHSEMISAKLEVKDEIKK